MGNKNIGAGSNECSNLNPLSVQFDEQQYVKGVVQEVREDKDIIVVRIRGSFFTTTGLAEFARSWAAEFMRKVA